MPTEGVRPGPREPWLSHREQGREVEARVLPPDQRCSGHSWHDRGRVQSWGGHCILFPRLAEGAACLRQSGLLGKKQQGPCGSHSRERATARNPSVHVLFSPKTSHKTACGDRSRCLGLANPTTAGVFRLFSQPHELFWDNPTWLAWKILAPKADVSFCSIYPLLHSLSSFLTSLESKTFTISWPRREVISQNLNKLVNQ